MKIYNCKIVYSENSLHVFISFYITAKTIYNLKKNLNKYSKKLSVRVRHISLKKKRAGKKLWFKPLNQKIKPKGKKIQKIEIKKDL